MSDDTLPALADDEEKALAALTGDTGLEDFDTSDYVMPRLRIDGKNTVFVENQSNQTFETMDVILLGLVKQRILWDVEVGEGDQPLCKSPDFKQGFPDVKNFPFTAAGMAKQDGPLPCESCALKEWGSHPRNTTPWCTEQHTYPLLQVLDAEEGIYAPAILTVQRSGIKNSRAYLSSFARQKVPLFTAVTRLSLTAQKRGSVDYAVPNFARVAGSDKNEWPMFADNYRSIREYLTSPPKREEEEAPTDVPNSTVTDVSDEEVPF